MSCLYPCRPINALVLCNFWCVILYFVFLLAMVSTCTVYCYFIMSLNKLINFRSSDFSSKCTGFGPKKTSCLWASKNVGLQISSFCPKKMEIFKNRIPTDHNSFFSFKNQIHSSFFKSRHHTVALWD